ncbi:MAG: hypothetical protein CVV13_10175 [Gammaproteobacteria bacterium HGW-Gammaproteobacteria-3]|nr:MAG: hypothetical protein CVV13_10175 [Gammaproteobacteria bacterium HGW-Gammaproteobacteria-3]
MPELVHDIETRGRLVLWFWTLNECEMQLKALKTLESAIEQQFYSRSDPDRDAEFRRFCETKPDHQPGSVALSHILEFNAIRPLPFPTFSDLFVPASGIKMLLVVLFSQILISGNAESGGVAANKNAFVQEHLAKIVNESLGQAAWPEFWAFCNSCRFARDKMIGHADGQVFNVVQGETVTSCRGLHAAVKEIDFAYMHSVVERIRPALGVYMNRRLA